MFSKLRGKSEALCSPVTVYFFDFTAFRLTHRVLEPVVTRLLTSLRCSALMKLIPDTQVLHEISEYSGTQVHDTLIEYTIILSGYTKYRGLNWLVTTNS